MSNPPKTGNDTVLTVSGLKTYFETEDGLVKAVDGVDFRLRRGEILGLVGESGCGKSVTSLSIMRLITPPGKITAGKILFEDSDLLSLSETEMDHLRGNRISMIFQQPQSCLNPVFATGEQVAETMQIHTSEGRQAISEKTIQLFHDVGIPDHQKKVKAYPHEMSGGQAQRVMIAMAMAMNPEILIADEPTTALDVTIQAQILNLIRNLCSNLGTSVLLITHDLGVVAEMADRVAVMYAGTIVEQADVRDLFKHPYHPYTLGLLKSIPIPGRRSQKLDVIPGTVPNLINLPKGCRFAQRCASRVQYNLSICEEVEPPVMTGSTGHSVRCWLYENFNSHTAPLTME